MDRRLTPANARVAAETLRGTVSAPCYTQGSKAEVQAVVADLLNQPDGPRDSQLLLGMPVTLYEDRDGWSFVQGPDRYVGYIRSEDIGAPTAPNYRVATIATHSYTAEDFKSRERHYLPFGAQVTVIDERRKFFETTLGFIPKRHLRPIDLPFADPVTIAQSFFGVPYLWGGVSSFGIDCSGLIQTALRACGLPCLRDSDQQRDSLGLTLPDGAALARGDLIFWPGHVGIMVDDETLLHANAHHMAVAYEPIAAAILRIETQEGHSVQRRARL